MSATRTSGDEVMHTLLQSLSLCCNSKWSAPKPIGACTLETTSVEGWGKKAIRVIRHVKCDCDSFGAFMVNHSNKSLYEPTLQSHELISASPHSDIRIFHTKYKSSGLVSARDFCTQSVYGELPEAQIAQIMESFHSAAIPDAGPGFFLAVIDSKVVPPAAGMVRGTVHAYGYFAIPMTPLAAPHGQRVTRVVHVSCVDPNGSIPSLAWEATFKDSCKKVDKIAELVILFHNMKKPGTRALVFAATPVEQHHDDDSSHVPTVAAPARAAEISAEEEQKSDIPTRHVDPTLPDVAVEVEATSAPVVVAAAADAPPVQRQEDALPTPIAQPVVEPEPELPTRRITDAQRPLIQVVVGLFQNKAWTLAKTLENCVMETCPVPGTDQKALRISTDFNCSLDSLEAFLADEAQVRKYDPTLDKFEIIEHTSELTTIYTNYKQVSRFVTPRDFCTVTATAMLGEREAQEQGFHGHSAVFVQSSISNDKIRPAQSGYVRGVIHAFGYVAVPRPDGRGIRVSNIVRVDPGGSIPKWVIEAAQAENCKKLAVIRRLCEEWEKNVASLPPVKRANSKDSFRSDSSSRALAAPPPKPQTPASPATPPSPAPTPSNSSAAPAIDSPAKASASLTTAAAAAEIATEGSVASAEFHSCLDEDDFEEQVTELRNFYDPEAKAVCDAVMSLHARRGWQEQNFIAGCRVETMLTELCDKKAVRVSCDFQCTLEAFRATIGKIELVRHYDPSLERLEIMNSPPYGTVLYTSYKSGSRLVSSRDFCTLCCERLLPEEEGAAAGLYTEGIRSSAFVQASVNCKDMPEQKGYVRGVVHAFGYIAIATPPESERIRVFNIALIDPCGSINPKLVDAAVGETCHKLEAVRRLAETGAWKAGGAPASSPARASVAAGSPPSSSSPPPPLRTVTPAALEASKYPEIDTTPLFNRLFRMHTSRGWSSQKQVGKCLVDTLQVDYADVKAQRFSTEFLCSLSTFEEFLSSAEDIRKYNNHLETIRFLDSPPNASVTYTAYRSTSRFLASRDFCTMTAMRRMSDDEASDLGLFTKGIKSELLVQSAINCKDMPDQEGYVRGVVHAFGFIAIATPPTAKRIRVFHYACIDPCGSVPAKVVEYTIAETAEKLAKMNVLCQQREAERETMRRTLVVDNDESDAETPQKDVEVQSVEPTAPAAAPASNEVAPVDGGSATPVVAVESQEQPSQSGAATHLDASQAASSARQSTTSSQERKSKRVSFSPMALLEEESRSGRASDAGGDAAPSSAAVAAASIITSRQRIVFDRLVKLHARRDWKMVSVVDGCLMEEVGVDFSDKKALRISTDFKCPLETFVEFLADEREMRKYDPSLDQLLPVALDGELLTVYTSYKQVSRFVTPRDFCVISSSALLPGDAAAEELGIEGFNAVYIQNSGSTLRAKPEVKGYVRGQIHVFGFIATATEGSSTIKVHNIVCADPGGKIPQWVMDAAKAENCKKLATMRRLCEAYVPHRSDADDA